VSQGQRYLFVDQMRGLVIALMGLDHASNYFNAVWKRVTYDNFLFDTPGQFVIRYLSYLCAPGFLMLAGAMVWLSLQRRTAQGVSCAAAKLAFVQRGAFLILVQLVWVNASWGGFERLRLDHFGIIACIGGALILMALIANLRWWLRLLIALAIVLIHPLLLRIPYETESIDASTRLMQLLVDAGKWNLYPVLPWFALAGFGSVAAEAWFRRWGEDRGRIRNSLLVSLLCFALFLIVRVPQGYGNILPYDAVGSVSFFFVQKYPPSLGHSFLFPGLIMLLCAVFMLVGGRLRPLFHPLEVYGRTPFFFYVIHIPLLALATKRSGLLPWKEGEVGTALVAWVVLLIVMYPLCRGFGAIKARTSNPLIRMM
jgi:uncharacterized membrane protein